MNILNKLCAIEFDRNKNKILGIKSGILWGYSNETNGSFPLLYISKPKHVSEEDFEILLNNLEIKINKPAE